VGGFVRLLIGTPLLRIFLWHRKTVATVRSGNPVGRLLRGRGAVEPYQVPSKWWA
jgi:hypothetical protein